MVMFVPASDEQITKFLKGGEEKEEEQRAIQSVAEHVQNIIVIHTPGNKNERLFVGTPPGAKFEPNRFY